MKFSYRKPAIVHLFIIFLTGYVIAALLVDLFFKLPPEVSRMLAIIDDLICVFFLSEFVFSFVKAKNKLKFMRWGWIDLLSSIPVYHFLSAGKTVFAIVRILRIFRAYRSIRILIKYVFKNKIKGTFQSAALFAVLCIIFSSIAILQVEKAPNSNIHSAEDALWWSLVTITTVGYGDLYPVTALGRLIGAVLIIVGVALFGIFTGYIASWFTNIGHQEKLLHEKKHYREIEQEEVAAMENESDN